MAAFFFNQFLMMAVLSGLSGKKSLLLAWILDHSKDCQKDQEDDPQTDEKNDNFHNFLFTSIYPNPVPFGMPIPSKNQKTLIYSNL
jgi:hypothetical protein